MEQTISMEMIRSQVSEIELVYRSKVNASQRPLITQSKDAADLLRAAWNENSIELCEAFKVLLLNKANRVLAIYEVSIGGITATIVDPRLIFTAALKVNATSLIMAHNHPSGNLQPSPADEALTAKIKEAGKYLEIKVLDHVILTAESYFSFADEGLLW